MRLLSGKAQALSFLLRKWFGGGIGSTIYESYMFSIFRSKIP